MNLRFPRLSLYWLSLTEEDEYSGPQIKDVPDPDSQKGRGMMPDKSDAIRNAVILSIGMETSTRTGDKRALILGLKICFFIFFFYFSSWLTVVLSKKLWAVLPNPMCKVGEMALQFKLYEDKRAWIKMRSTSSRFCPPQPPRHVRFTWRHVPPTRSQSYLQVLGTENVCVYGKKKKKKV